MSPASPHQGGIYEAAVKSAKFHLVRVIGNKIYTFGQYLTLLAQIEAILNSRPLYTITDDPTDSPVITPAHFIIGEPLIMPPPISSPPKTDFSLQRVRRERQRMVESFWHSWSADYVTSLLPRKKWTKVQVETKIGQLVLVKDDNLPPAQWQMGKIVELLPSKSDENSRSVVIQMPNGRKFTRAVQKICILPTEAEMDVVIHDVAEMHAENVSHNIQIAQNMKCCSVRELQEME